MVQCTRGNFNTVKLRAMEGGFTHRDKYTKGNLRRVRQVDRGFMYKMMELSTKEVGLTINNTVLEKRSAREALNTREIMKMG